MASIKDIKKRVSTRTFEDTLSTEELVTIKDILDKKRVGPFGNEISFSLIDTTTQEAKEIGKLSSYGLIKGATHYFGGYCKSDRNSIIDYGYAFEEVVLELTKLGLGTCWLGGTFNRGYVVKSLNLPEGMVIPAISPVGRISDRKSTAERLARTIAKADKRKTFETLFFQLKDNVIEPVSEKGIGGMKEVLEAIQLAPSASNKQPWRVVIDNKTLHLYLEFNEKYNKTIKDFNIQELDMGIAILHMEVAAREIGLEPLFSDSNPNLDSYYIYITSCKL